MSQHMDTWYTGDEHHGHQLLCDLRGFAKIADMEESLIAQHNAVVKRHDRVIHLGDFAHRIDDEKRLRRIFGALNGQHFLVIGNHENSETLRLPWAGEPKHMMLLKDGDQRICASHYAMRVWPSMKRAIHIYGHSHNRIPADSLSCDVGVDAWSLMPCSLAQIQQRLAMSPAHVDAETQEMDGGPKL